MEKKIILFVLIVAAIAFSGCTQQPSQALPNQQPGSASKSGDVYYEEERTDCIPGGECLRHLWRVWLKADAYRVDSFSYDGGNLSVSMASNKQLYMYIPTSKQWTEKTISDSDFAKHLQNAFIMFEDIPCWQINPNTSKYAKNFSEEEINGIKLQKFDCEIPGKEKFTVWFWKEKNLLYKTESGQNKRERKNFKFDPIPDSVFTKTLKID